MEISIQLLLLDKLKIIIDIYNVERRSMIHRAEMKLWQKIR